MYLTDTIGHFLVLGHTPDKHTPGKKLDGLRGQTKHNILASPKSEYEEAHGTTVMFSEMFYLVSGLDTLSLCCGRVMSRQHAG